MLQLFYALVKNRKPWFITLTTCDQFEQNRKALKSARDSRLMKSGTDSL